ncbi:hypothetical protein RE428_32300 [Marinobacter nanhaiticus D15-8W]|uniref:hypothetical protein n=1 Tax=Marinobacter nanhaiticus TaxID=1305740 RepID=UPI0003A34351|nr:hypothetical protein [Marinobacter nanhaiticus]BES72212.1 hypothetical protein RE428_32300 [Marinobacter nanhaiticus D15-8W]
MTDPMEYITDTPTIYDYWAAEDQLAEDELKSRYSDKLRVIDGEIVEVDCE